MTSEHSVIADLLTTRLYWSGMRGVARLDGREVHLTAPPHLPGLQIEAIDYAPGECAVVMPKREGWRDLERHEVDAARALLLELTKAGELT